ncbi:MAG: leucine-rich repeat domain-containing protein [Vicingaceae bacterium]|nr:leucine-rich repeat domain-containing protein [Vicingaceae bacterium]
MTKSIPYKYLPNFFATLISLVFLTNINAQILDKKAMKKLPIYTLEQAVKLPVDEVVRLTLKKSKLTELPQEIYNFKNLRYLDVSGNQLKEIPAELANLPQLQYLDFSDNLVTEVPKAIGKFDSLTVLILNHNDIVTLPTEIGALKKLTELHLWGTAIVSFPNSIVLLKETLKEIDLRYVPLTRSEHKKLKKILPLTKIGYSLKCNCDF